MLLNAVLFPSLKAPNNEVEFYLAGDGDAPEYFYINPTGGEITLLQSVLETETTIYRVSVFRSNDHN